MNLTEVSSIITAVGVLFAGFQLMQGRKQRHREFEDAFVQRYWQIMDGLSLDGMKGVAPKHRPCENDEVTALRYFRLCEDELELWKSGWISAATWRVWAPGISTILGREPFQNAWAEAMAREEALPKAQQQFSLLRAHAEDVGSLKRLPWWRRVASTG